jgi:hypothetical protein
MLTASVLVVSIALMSCAASDSPEIDRSIMPSETATPVVDNVATDTSKVVQPGSEQGISITAPVKALPATNSKGSSAPNPAHGQPGHRCDIAVGAPLNSPVASSAQPQVQTVSASPAPVSVTTTTGAASAGSNPTLNPAHGQPGHDCSIAVGAPLKKN